jgi:hypothetical protein
VRSPPLVRVSATKSISFTCNAGSVRVSEPVLSGVPWN